MDDLESGWGAEHSRTGTCRNLLDPAASSCCSYFPFPREDAALKRKKREYLEKAENKSVGSLGKEAAWPKTFDRRSAVPLKVRLT